MRGEIKTGVDRLAEVLAARSALKLNPKARECYRSMNELKDSLIGMWEQLVALTPHLSEIDAMRCEFCSRELSVWYSIEETILCEAFSLAEIRYGAESVRLARQAFVWPSR